jgi:outer membrane protein assembly factor BamB
VDPHDNRVTDRVALKTPAGARFIGSELLADPADPAILWIAGGDGVLGFDTRALRVTQAILPGRGPTYVDSFGASASGLWIATDDAHLLRYDRGSHARRAVVRLPHDLTGLAGFVILGADANSVILDTGSEVARVNARTGKQAWRTPSLTNIRAAAVAQGKVWIVASDTTHPRDRLLALDTLTGRLLTSTTLPDFSTVAILPTGSALWIPTAGGTVDIVAGTLR